MKPTKNTVDLICQLEYIIGSQVRTYSGDCIKYPVTAIAFRYNGFPLDRPMMEQKRWLPIEYEKENYDFGKPEIFVENLHYCFGSYKLYIGDGIIAILEYLEKRYDIDFARMEADLLDTQK